MTTEAAPPLAEGRYRLLEPLGIGGMAAVYRAFDTRLQVHRAIKILHPALSNRPRLRARFEAEARTMALLEHRNIVRVYDVGVEQGRVYIVMELVEGGSLVERLEKVGPLHPRQAVSVAIDILAALEVSHAHGVIHRDIKPHNVLITTNDEIRVTDFGIARLTQTPDSFTKTGAVMGTWAFMAPEQRADAKNVDERADLYSVAATLYTAVTNETPMDLFAAELDAKMLARLPEVLVPVVQKATRYDREERYASAREMAAALRELLEQLPPLPADAPPLALPPELRQSGKEPPSSGPAPVPTMIPEDGSGSTFVVADALQSPPAQPAPEEPPPEAPAPRPSQEPAPAEEEQPPSLEDWDEATTTGALPRKGLLAALLLGGLAGTAVAVLVAVKLLGAPQEAGTEPSRTTPAPEAASPASAEESSTVDEATPGQEQAAAAVAPEPEQAQVAPEPPTSSSPAHRAGSRRSTRSSSSSRSSSHRSGSSSGTSAPAASGPPSGAPEPSAAAAAGEQPASSAASDSTAVEEAPSAAPAAPSQPSLQHAALSSASLGSTVTLRASVKGSSDYHLVLYYRPNAPGETYRRKTMVRSGDHWEASITLDESFAPGLLYHIAATPDDPSLPVLHAGSGFKPISVSVH